MQGSLKKHEMVVPPTPSTAEAVADVVDGRVKKTSANDSTTTDTLPSRGHVAAAFMLLIFVVGHATAASSITLHAPALPVWREVGAAFALGASVNTILAVIIWRANTLFALVWSAAALCLPFFLPMHYGISASAVALINFIGAWKTLDIVAGTAPKTVLDGGLGGLIAHFASPVEYRIARGREAEPAKALVARPGLWMAELRQTTQDYAGLALAGMVRSTFGAVASPWSGAGVLYAEVWTVYLFLRLFTGAFATLLALAGYHGRQMWGDPLTRATSISDFWSRRWNLLIHGLFRRTVFAPLTARGVPASAAGALAFALSGAFHEYAFALQQPSLRSSLGRCMLFFLLQAPVVSLEKLLRTHVGVPALFATSSALCTLVWTLLLVPPAPLFLHPLKTSGVFEQIYLLVPRLQYHA